MTEERDELLDRLRRANPVTGSPPRATDAVRADVLSLASRHRLRLRLPRRRQDGDPFEHSVDRLLRSANPAPARLDDERARLHAASLLASLTASPSRRPSVGRARRGLAVVVLATACVAASAFGYVFAQRDVTDAASVRCYQAASLGADYVGVTEGSDGPIGTCRAEVWSKGGFGTPSSPPLVGCVMAAGVEGVFPGRDDATCTQLDLSAALAPTPAAARLAELRRLLIADLDPNDHCLPPAAARPIVLGDLARTKVSGWSVRVEPGASSTRPCTQAFVVTSAREIELMPFPRLVGHRPVTTGPSVRGVSSRRRA